MLKHLIATVVAVFAVTQAAAISVTDSLLRRLDGMIEVRDDFNNERREKITAKQRDLATCKSPADVYAVCRDLYSLYRNYRIDSALIIARMRLDNARLMERRDKVVSASLNMAEALAASGATSTALAILDSIPRDGLPPYQSTYLYNTYVNLYRSLAAGDIISDDRLEHLRLMSTYRDSLATQYASDEPQYYLLNAERKLTSGDPRGALGEMDELQRRIGIADDVRAHLLLASISGVTGNNTARKEHLARAAILEMENGNLQGTALLGLAQLLNDEGDTDRAYAYIRAAFEDASKARARGRAAQILESFPMIDNAYAAHDREQRRTLTVLLGLVVVMAAALGLSLALVVRSRRKYMTASDKLNHNNLLLRELVDSLNRSNRERERYISEIFNAHSEFIQRMAALRKSLVRLLRSSQYQKAIDELNAPRHETDEIESLYARFDTIFLNMYPQFVDEVNRCLRPEARYAAGLQGLTPELRVLALMRLGITSSVRIAEMLHYSPQTVYNYCSRVRALLSVSRADFDAVIAGKQA